MDAEKYLIEKNRMIKDCSISCSGCPLSGINNGFNKPCHNMEKLHPKEAVAIVEQWAEEARAVLPNSLKTEVVMTANLREWRHFFKQRCQKAAHSQIRELALALLKYFHEELPEVFEDLWEIYYYSDIAFDLPEVREAWQTE